MSRRRSRSIPKTVERWITKGRVPHRTHRWSAAKLLGTDEASLCPEIMDDARTQVRLWVPGRALTGTAPAPRARRTVVRPLPDQLRPRMVTSEPHELKRKARMSMARVDYLNDPAAPPANSIVPSVTAIVLNERGELLLVHKTDNELWALPGGAVDVGESVSHAVIREVPGGNGGRRRGNGVGGPLHRPGPRHDLRRRRSTPAVSMCFTTRMAGGEPATGSETKEVAFVDPSKLDSLNIHPSMRMRIDHYLDHRSQPYIG